MFFLAKSNINDFFNINYTLRFCKGFNVLICSSVLGQSSNQSASLVVLFAHLWFNSCKDFPKLCWYLGHNVKCT